MAEDEDAWTVEQNSFVSTSLKSRPKQGHYRRLRPISTHLARFKPTGTCFLLDLEPDLRERMLKEALERCEYFGDILNIFLTCRLIYIEAAAIFYQTVRADITNRWCEVPNFLMEKHHDISPRLYITSMTIRMYLKVNLDLFTTFYPYILQTMVDVGLLESVELEIRGRSSEFHDYRGPSYGSLHLDEREAPLLVGRNQNIKQVGPAFLAKFAFQRFLYFLRTPRIPSLSLYVVDNDHYAFWCPFHKPTGDPNCGRSQRPPKRRLKIDIKALVRHLLVAQIELEDTDEAVTEPSTGAEAIEVDNFDFMSEAEDETTPGVDVGAIWKEAMEETIVVFGDEEAASDPDSEVLTPLEVVVSTEAEDSALTRMEDQ